MPHVRPYALIDPAGNELGTLVAYKGHWRPGEVLRRAGDDLRVIRVVEAEPGDKKAGYLVVEVDG